MVAYAGPVYGIEDCVFIHDWSTGFLVVGFSCSRMRNAYRMGLGPRHELMSSSTSTYGSS